MWGSPQQTANQAELESVMNKQFEQRQRGWPSMDYAKQTESYARQTLWPHWSGPQEHHEHEHDEDDESKHHCTDLFCLVIFLAAVAGLGCLLIYSSIEGDTRRLYHGYNFTGSLCGVDAPDQPYVFWCKQYGLPTGEEALDLRHPICVEACPTNLSTHRTCFNSRQQGITTTELPGGVIMQEEHTKYVWTQVNDYESAVYLGRYCLPEDLELKAPLMRILNKYSMTKVFMETSQLTNAVLPLMLAVVMAIVLGYVYLLILDKFALCMVYTSIALIVISTIFMGLHLLIEDFTGGVDGIPHTGDSTWNTIVAIVLLCIGGGFCCFACVMHASIEVAIGCVQAACECIFDMLELLLEPLVMLLLKTATIFGLLAGAVQLASVGSVNPKSLEEFSDLYEIPGHEINGVFRTFQYHQDQIWYVSYYVFVSLWILCFFTALSQFVLAYAAQLWYFTPYVQREKDYPSCPLCRGYWIGTKYHAGSLAFGSFIIPPFYILRAFMSIVAHEAHYTGNCVLELLSKCCLCCLVCYQHCFEFLNKNAYIDIAINSTGFCEAAKDALSILNSEITAIAYLNGATWVFKLSGYALISGGGTFFVWILVRNVAFFCNEDSDHHIHDPVMVCILASALCFTVAVGFMVVFDTVSDTMLYCFAVEEQRKQKGLLKPHVQYAPQTLHHLIEENSHHKGDPKQEPRTRTRLASASDDEDGHEWFGSSGSSGWHFPHLHFGHDTSSMQNEARGVYTAGTVFAGDTAIQAQHQAHGLWNAGGVLAQDQVHQGQKQAQGYWNAGSTVAQDYANQAKASFNGMMGY